MQDKFSKIILETRQLKEPRMFFSSNLSYETLQRAVASTAICNQNKYGCSAGQIYEYSHNDRMRIVHLRDRCTGYMFTLTEEHFNEIFGYRPYISTDGGRTFEVGTRSVIK